MKHSTSSLLRAGLLSFTMLVPAASHALTITANDDADLLADTLFLNLPGLNVTNATTLGQSSQFGTYSNVTGTYGLPQTGIILSSGDVTDYGISGGDSGAENSTSFGTDASPNQTALLDQIASAPNGWNDVAQLNIEFLAADNVTEVSFFGAFGSEEYPEFIGEFIDGFGLFVNDEVNVATVTPFNGAQSLPINIDHPSMMPFPGTILNGVLAPGNNPVLRFDAPVNPGEVNNFTIIIADANDHILDTTVYISSFIANNSGPGGEPIPATGTSEFDPLLPLLNEDGEPVFTEEGGFIIDITADQFATGETIWIDPPVAIGYEYSIDGGNLFTEITLPSFATIADLDGYSITIGGTTYDDIAAGSVFNIFAETGVTGFDFFEVSGIDVSLSLDPSNPLAFPIGIKSNATNGASVTITPNTVDVGNPSAVPLPATGLLYIGAVLMGGGLLRRQSKAA